MLRTILTGETFRRIIISILILSMMLTFGTAFVSHEPPTLREIDPYYFDPDMLPSMTDEQMLSLFDMEPQLVSDFSREHNELSELSEAELAQFLRAFEPLCPHCMNIEFTTILNSGLSYSGLTVDNRSFIFEQLDISYAASNVVEQLFAVMERDGYSLAQSIELVMIMSGGLFDYAEARHILRTFPSSYRRLLEVQRFEQFAKMFDITGEVNSRRLVESPFNDIADNTLADISVLLNANRGNVQYSFEIPERNASDGQTSEECMSIRRTVFTSATAFNEARRMFLSSQSAAGTEMAFELGAALGADPRTFMPQDNSRDITSEGHTSAAELSAILFGDVANINCFEIYGRPSVISPRSPSQSISYLTNHDIDIEATLSVIDVDVYELRELKEYGMGIMNFTPTSATPTPPTHEGIVENPFRLHFGVNESVILNTGASTYRMNILRLPGRNGFGLNLDLVYNSSDADLRRLNLTTRTAVQRRDLHGLGVGWMLDLPYIYDNVLYVPGRGTFTLNGNQILEYTLHDMQLFNDNSFVSGQLTSNRRLRFLNGTEYFFNGARVIGMRDRFGNTIRIEYATITQFGNMMLPTRITDTAGKVITFNYTASGNNRTVTITDPGGGVYSINMSRIAGQTGNSDFQINSVSNQVGAVVNFGYYLGRLYFDFNSKTPRHLNHALALTTVTYPSGATLHFYYGNRTINLGASGSRHAHIVTAGELRSDGKAFLRTTFTYQGEPTAFPQHVDRPPANHTYSTTVVQNNGLRTVYTFNNFHLNTLQRIYNAENTLLSAQTITYNNDRLPTNITLTEHRGTRTRETTQQFTYNRYGQVTQSVSPLAQGSTLARYRTDHTYDNRFGLPLTTTSRPDASTTVIERNTLSADGRRIIRTVIEENGTRRTQTDFEHDAYGNVTRILEFPNNVGNSFTGAITTEIAFDRGTMPNSIRTINVRDANNALVGGSGIVERRFTYDAMWRTLSETDPNGYVTRWQYDNIGRVTRIDFPNGGFVTYAYNDQQNTLTNRTILGAIYTYRYDGFGNLVSITAPGGVAILSNMYDNRMRLIETRNAQGIASSTRTTFEYDIFDRVIDTQSLNSAGGVMRREEIVYNDISDAAGNSRITTIVHGGTNAPSVQTFVQYDRFGRLTQEGVVGGRVVNYTHDLAGRVTRETSLGIDNTFTYNVFGVTSVRNIEGNTSLNTYDSMGRLSSRSDFMGNVQRFTYDALGRLIRQEVPFERIGFIIHRAMSRYFYDVNGNVLRTENLVNLPSRAQVWAGTENTFRHNMLISSQTGGESGIRAEYTYDLAGNILTKRIGDAVTTYTYNNRGQLTQIRDALGQVESFTYDANGLLLTRTDRNGTLFRITYDNMGRLIREEAFVNGMSQGFRAYIFYATGALLSETNGTHTITYRFDAQGRVSHVEETGGIVRTYTYNTANNVITSRVAVNGAVHQNNTYAYDIAQRMRTVSANGVLLSTYSYNANGNRISKVLSNGVRTDYTHNLAGLITSLTNSHGGNILSSFKYTYYLDGNTSSVFETIGDEIRTVTYSYDLARRLIREEMQDGMRPPPMHVVIEAMHGWDGVIRCFGCCSIGQLKATVYPLGADQNVTWHAYSHNILNVNQYGIVGIDYNICWWCCSGFCRWCCGVSVLIRATAANRVSATVMVRIDAGASPRREYDELDLPSVDYINGESAYAYVDYYAEEAYQISEYYVLAIEYFLPNCCEDCVPEMFDMPTLYETDASLHLDEHNALIDFEPFGAAGGGLFSVVVKDNGTVWAWGSNSSGRLGDGTTTDRHIPVQVHNLTNIVAVAASAGHSVAIREDGTVWAWGANSNGQLGDGTTIARHIPVQVHNLTNIVAVAAGTAHSVALREDGTVWAWGSNSSGQLGDGTTIARHTPVQVQKLTNVVAIAANSTHSIALRFDGAVWDWGSNSRAGTTFVRHTPAQVHNLTNVVEITAGNEHSLALRADGIVWAWGSNSSGQLGDGTTTTRSTPVQVRGLTDVADIAAGGSHTVAVREDGTVWTWGFNSNGQLGDGTTTRRLLPVQVLGAEGQGFLNVGARSRPQRPRLPLAGLSFTREYTFDNRGNRVTMTVAGSENYIVTYTYDINNRLLSSTRTDDDVEVSTFTYDHNGNQLTMTTGNRTETRTYNALNQLTRVEMPGIIATYAYRANGLRRSKTVNGVTTTHVWDGANIVLEQNASGGVINVFNRDARGNLLRSLQHGFYLFNARGDVIQRVDAQGNVLHTYRYDAFGNELNVEASEANPNPPCTETPRIEITATKYVYVFSYWFAYVYGQLTAVVYPPEANQNVTWSSGNPAMLWVGGNGQFWTDWLFRCCCSVFFWYYNASICCCSPFSVTITATAENGVTGTYELVLTWEMFSVLSQRSDFALNPDDIDFSADYYDILRRNPFKHPLLIAEREATPAAQDNAMTSEADHSFVREYTFDLDDATIEQNANTQDAFVFGVEENPLPVNTNPFRFAGEYFDLSTGTYYLRARHYNPTTGRFTQEDPIRHGRNWYVFGANNPVFFIDPSGLAEVRARAYAEAMGATVTWLGNVGNTAVANITYAGRTVTFTGQLVNGNMMIDPARLHSVFGWGTPAPSLVLGGNTVAGPAIDTSTVGSSIFTQIGPTSGPTLFYLFGTDQQSHALRNITLLSRRFRVFYAYVPTPTAFAAAWNALPTYVNILVANVHSAPTWSCNFEIVDLNHRTIDTFLFLGCNAAHLDVSNNLANQFLANHSITQLVAVDGNHSRAPAPFTGISSGPGEWFFASASTIPYLWGEGMMTPRGPQGFILHRDGEVSVLGYSFVSVNHLLRRIGR